MDRWGFESMSVNHSEHNTLDDLAATINTFSGEANRSLKPHRRQNNKAITYKHRD